MRHLVMFSGGAASWAAARRVADRGNRPLLLFADTKIEDEDTYRFLKDVAADVDGELIVVAEGRTPWQVFRDVRFLGNTRIDPCSRILKRELLRKWLEENCDPSETVVYLGYTWDEDHRAVKSARFWAPWKMESPMCEPPYIDKVDILRALTERGIRPPRLYAMGFHHNNCGGFCVKGGQAQFANLLRTMPERYREHEAQEEALRAYLGKDVAIMRDRTGGDSTPLTMREFREKLELQPSYFDADEWGGCGCFDQVVDSTTNGDVQS